MPASRKAEQAPDRLPNPAALPDYSLLLELRALDYQTIVGVDEVGRGALAGPVVVAAVQITTNVSGVTDSKQLPKHHRTQVAQRLHNRCSLIRFGSADNHEIDTLGLSRALSVAYERALTDVEADLVLTDHYTLPTPHRFIRATKGETLFYPVAAASVVAKVYRDQLMAAYHLFYPDYNWQTNAGYGTASHLAALYKSGLSPLHRSSFLRKSG